MSDPTPELIDSMIFLQEIIIESKHLGMVISLCYALRKGSLNILALDALLNADDLFDYTYELALQWDGTLDVFGAIEFVNNLIKDEKHGNLYL